MWDPLPAENELPAQSLLETSSMRNGEGAHSATPVKIEALDPAMLVPPPPEPQSYPVPSQISEQNSVRDGLVESHRISEVFYQQPAYHLVIPESGCGNLDLPPSPPPLPLVYDSVVASETHDVLSIETGPSVYQIRNKPPVEKPQNMHQNPDQSIKESKIEVETDPLVSGTADTNRHEEEQMEARQMDLNCSEGEVPDGSSTEMARHVSVTRNWETHAPPGSDTIVPPSGTDYIAAASVRRKFHHIKSAGMATHTQGHGWSRTRCRQGTALVDPVYLEEPRKDGRQHFTSLLWMAPSQHRTSIISNHPSEIISVRYRHSAIPYHPLCEPALKRLGLYQISQMRHISVDRFLIAALVERWRPETHTFHMPVGEMTITLQDVSCLWGLPIQGDPIIGESDAMWGPTIEKYLGIPISEQRMQQKKRKKKGTKDVVITYSGYSISLPMLRERFHAMPANPTQAQIEHYTRAFVLDLLGSVIFQDATGKGVPAMYLQFLKNLEEHQQYNWGAAALAVLYRALCMGAETDTRQIAGPVLLLQLWSWTHLTVGRPIDRDNNPPKWGTPDLESSPAYGAKWCTRHLFPSLPRNAGIQHYRNQFDLVCEGWVTWCPYDQVMHLMPMRVQNDRPFWLARIPLIYFWVIEYHYPDRVMRQFGLFQTIPPPLPNKEAEVRRLHKIKHASSRTCDWSVVHRDFVVEYSDSAQRMVVEDRPDDPGNLPAYHQWFQQEGMHTVFLDGHYEVGFDGTIPRFCDTVEVTGYVSSKSALDRVALRSIKQAAWGIKLQLARGWKKVGKVVLQTCYGNLKDTRMEHRLQEMLKEAGLPLEIDELPSDDSPRAYFTPMPQPPNDMNVDVMDDWLYSGRGFTRYLNAGLGIGESNQVTLFECKIEMSNTTASTDWSQPEPSTR